MSQKLTLAVNDLDVKRISKNDTSIISERLRMELGKLGSGEILFFANEDYKGRIEKLLRVIVLKLAKTLSGKQEKLKVIKKGKVVKKLKAKLIGAGITQAEHKSVEWRKLD